MNKYLKLTQAIVIAALVNTGAVANETTIIGPTHYLSTADSPFIGLNFNYFHLEDFEDQLFNVPGVSATVGSGITSIISGPNNVDSVDADDGVIDGSGSNGESFFRMAGFSGIRFTFNASVLGSLPTHVGIVWTDGAGVTSFNAYDENGFVFGGVGPVLTATTGTSGQTDEDSFFGATNLNGIGSILIRNSEGGIEVDHLQYGFADQSDIDNDGVGDALDNCTTVVNPNQIDTDSDGYGNACDADFNNDCIVNFIDLAAFSNEFLGTNALFDLNNDGAVNFLDFAVLSNTFLSAPGPGLGTCQNGVM